jgi:ABC-type phosphonate transport system ATPase subunit
MTSSRVLRVEGLEHRYGAGEAPVYASLDFDMPAGRILAVLGQNASENRRFYGRLRARRPAGGGSC